MHRDEQVGLRLVGDAGALVERNVVVVLPGVDHVHSEAAFEQLAQALRDFEDQIFFQQAATADRAEVPAAVSGVDHDAHLGHARAQLDVFFGRRRNHDRQLVLFRFVGIREQIHGAFGIRADLADFDDQTVRIRLEADRESRVGLGLEHNARHAGHGLRHADAADERVADLDRFADQVGSELRVAQIEIDAVRAGEAMRFILDLILEIENYGARVGRRPVADSGDARKLRQLLRSGGRTSGLAGVGSVSERGSRCLRNSSPQSRTQREHRGAAFVASVPDGLDGRSSPCESWRCPTAPSSASTKLHPQMPPR